MGKKILVVDDDLVGLSLMQNRLTKEGYDVAIAMNGMQGLQVAEIERPVLVVLDVEMPEMNGYTFISELRKNLALKDTPVIMLTGHEENEKIFYRRGISGYLIKPVDFEKLLPLMQKLIPNG